MPENTILLENAGKLFAAAGQLASEGQWLTELILITIMIGLILAAFILLHLRRREQSDLLSAALLIVGLVGIVVGFHLFGIVGTPITLQWFAVAADDGTQSLLVEAKRIGGPLAALSVVGLVSGITYVSLAGIVIWNRWRERHREQQGSMEVAIA